ncbi:family 20 glycosylhydrolase, partial [Agrobacterium cavarae]|uniref:family 20 glycosylhydrolase n=1 Tax=Agrobacterium cavarae TaxID=2528239 RepID=UPI002FD98ED6
MSKTGFRLENAWHPIEGDPSGGFVFTLVNLTDTPISDFKLAYTALTRVMDNPACENATFLLRNANFHQYAPPAGFVLEPGASWRFTVRGLWRPAKHRTDGAKSAYLTFSDGTHHTIDVADLMLEGRVSEPQKPLLPEGRITEPFSLLPWPKHAQLQAGETPVVLYPAAGSTLADVKAMDTVLSLHRRLFSAAHQPFSLIAVEQGKAVGFQHSSSLAAEAYELTFAEDEIVLAYGGDAGRQYGLTALAQLHDGARRNAALFRFPVSGTITDEPRYGWRGCHLDVSRQFAPAPDVLRLIDILAWYKMNVFHWHLTDDEAWRFEVRAYPQLTTVGVMRGPDEPMLPQLGNAAEPVGGFYTQADVAAIIAHASELNVEVVPEVDIPGHSTAILAALPELVDGQEAPDSY